MSKQWVRFTTRVFSASAILGFVHWAFSMRFLCYRNSGLVLGIEAGYYLPTILALGVVVALTLFVKRNLETLGRGELIGFGLVLSGGLVNLIDRLFSGSVCDYIDISSLIEGFLIFNLPDLLITFGVVYLLFVKKSAHEQS